MNIQQNNSQLFKKTTLGIAISSVLAVANHAYAQTQIEEVVVTGIRGSLTRATEIKREATNFVDAISAEDIGKFPDLNVAESLQRITGVTIDRSGGVGQQVTVRGFGPQFNTVLVNGRQIANDSGGREFNFDVLSAEQITGASVYKSARADVQEGGIGATVLLDTARPFDKPGFYAVGSLKGIYETLSEEIAPSFSGVISNTFADDTVGALFSLTYQQRDVQINRIETSGWRSGLTISNNAGDTDPTTSNVLFEDVYFPRNWDQIVDDQDRTRINANLVFQFAPNDDLKITLDGTYNRFEVDSLVTDLASWFEPDRVREATLDEATRTVTRFSQDIGYSSGSGDPATDFVSHTRNRRDVTNTGVGLNFDYQINENLTAVLDLSFSSAENDRAGKDRFNVVGIINDYTFDGTGNIPTVQHQGFSDGEVLDSSGIRLHYNEKGNQPTDEDEVSEYKLDFEYTPSSEIVESIKFGAYAQQREKSQFQIFASQCEFCGYNDDAPLDTLGVFVFNAQNFFPGLIDTFYSYDGDAYVQYLASEGFPIAPTLQNNRYTVNEDIASLYIDFTFGFDIADMPVTINTGARYSNTSIDVEAVQSFISDVVPTADLTLFENRFGPATNIEQGTSYGNLLPSLNVKLDVTDDIVVRLARYDSLTRPTLSELSPATTFGEPRRQNLTASGGNPALQPFQAENFDMSVEWYYGAANLISVSFFSKEVDGFITSLTGLEVFTLADRIAANDFRCTGTDPSCAVGVDLDPTRPDFDLVANTEELNGAQEDYTVTRPQNGESADVTGFEIGITHIFENGFGFIANATFVDSNATFDPVATQNLALEGIGDSQNLIIFYEAERWQARIAYNNREGFLRNFDNGFNGEPVNTDRFSQIDISASYDINDTFQVFFEGINITEEELFQFGRFETQIYNIEDNGSRYAVGVRASF